MRPSTIGMALCAGALTSVGFAQPARADDSVVKIAIPSQSTEAALRELARQTGASILFSLDAVKGLRAPGVTAMTTAADAARMLLKGSGLEVVRGGNGAVLVRAQDPEAKLIRSAYSDSRPLVLAQAATPPAAADPGSAEPNGAALEEVVVTATRQTDSINRVALSVTAQTQRGLDQQGIRSIADLTGVVPALTVSQGAPGVAFVAIRGIQNNGAGSATTGVYLDDTPLTKRGAYGTGPTTANGTPLPPLFDLERVEVLRGPQGTLFGSGSQGGTLRYITPQPNLTRYSTYVRGEVSSTADGSPSYEGGVAVGGPIVEGKLGFRASLFERHTGGWLDYVNRVTTQQFAKDANEGETRVGRVVVSWAPTDRALVTFSYLGSRDHWRSRINQYYLSTNAPIKEPEACYGPTGVQLASCAAAGVAYRRGPLTLPQLDNLGADTSLEPFLAPTTTNLQVASLSFDYKFDTMSVKAITSYIDDQTKVVNSDGGAFVRTRATNADYGGILVRNLPAYAGLPDLPQEAVYGKFFANNKRFGLTQEIRFASLPNAMPFSWVAGLYYSNQRNTAKYDNAHLFLETEIRSVFGISPTQRFGVPGYDIDGVPLVGVQGKYQRMKDTEIAAFGEANYWITSKLRATAGIRWSRLDFDYNELHRGPASGGNNPLTIPGGVTGPISITESPLAPKLGLQYQVTSNDMVYLTAAKGFRPGGVNSSIPGGICDISLARFGASATGLPVEIKSDTVWSYEGGAKIRLLDNRLQLNGAVYRIDWKDIQTNVTIPAPCNIPFTTNAGRARSQGMEVEAQFRPFRQFTAQISMAYNDAKYTEDAVGLGRPGFEQLPAAVKGQHLNIPPFTLQIGGRYDVNITDTARGYVRVDWRYLQHVSNTDIQIFGTGAYSPTAVFPNVSSTNIRLGVEYGGLDINMFVKNLFNNREGVIAGGRASCPTAAAGGTAACANGLYNPYFTVSPAFEPRQIGIQIAYRR